MDIKQKQAISLTAINVIKSRLLSFPDNSIITRNAPFHKAFLVAFKNKLAHVNTDAENLLSISSWMHGLNTSFGQSFFEKIAHILSNGEKKEFKNMQIDSAKAETISEIMTDLKNAAYRPDIQREEALINAAESGISTNAQSFVADCFYEDDTQVIAIELKSVRPNSGQMRDEKQKILVAKEVLKTLYPTKNVRYLVGFPFDPFSETDTGYDKTSFMNQLVEFNKFFANDEVLLSDELWSFLSGEDNTMQDVLNIIKDVAKVSFEDDFKLVNTAHNIVTMHDAYREIIDRWHIVDELKIIDNWDLIDSSTQSDIIRCKNHSAFNDKGEYATNRANKLLGYIDANS